VSRRRDTLARASRCRRRSRPPRRRAAVSLALLLALPSVERAVSCLPPEPVAAAAGGRGRSHHSLTTAPGTYREAAAAAGPAAAAAGGRGRSLGHLPRMAGSCGRPSAARRRSRPSRRAAGSFTRHGVVRPDSSEPTKPPAAAGAGRRGGGQPHHSLGTENTPSPGFPGPGEREPSRPLPPESAATAGAETHSSTHFFAHRW
jgi:hypothetical protein